MANYENAHLRTTNNRAAAGAARRWRGGGSDPDFGARNARNLARFTRQSRANGMQLKSLKINDGVQAYPSIFEGYAARAGNTRMREMPASYGGRCYNQASPRARHASDILTLGKGLVS